MPAKKIRIGKRAVCKSCDAPIIFKGEYWEHEDGKKRHPAEPKE